MTRLHDWQVFSNYLGEFRLTGYIEGDTRPKFAGRDGRRIYTSPLVSMIHTDDGLIAVTHSGTRYALGSPVALPTNLPFNRPALAA